MAGKRRVRGNVESCYFQKAFAGDSLYAADVADLKRQDLLPKQRYETLAVADVQAACDVCLPTYEADGGRSGFVSLEVSPELAHDAEGTVAEARRLHRAIGRKKRDDQSAGNR